MTCKKKPIFFILFMALVLPNAIGAMNQEDIPEITIFHDTIYNTLQASCCIKNVITYYEIYEDRAPAVGTYLLESERSAPQRDAKIVQLLEQAIIAYAHKSNIPLQTRNSHNREPVVPAPKPHESKESKPHAKSVRSTHTQHASSATPLIQPPAASNCCQKCKSCILL